MTSKFVDLKLVDGSRIIVNTAYITLVSPTHGNDFENGADVVFVVFGEQGALQGSVAAKNVASLLDVLSLKRESQFIELMTLSGAKVIFNRDFITHVTATHGNDLSNGADISVWGMEIQIGAKDVPSLLPLLI